MLLLLLFSVYSFDEFNLDESNIVLLPVGQTIHCYKKAEIHLAWTWVVEDPEITRLQFKTTKPKGLSPSPFSVKTLSTFEITCTRDCKIGEEFRVKLNYKDLINKLVKDSTEILIKVVEHQKDL